MNELWIKPDVRFNDFDLREAVGESVGDDHIEGDIEDKFVTADTPVLDPRPVGLPPPTPPDSLQ